ncbi:TetR/AcrR family transcriptional regulator [Vibrio tapetis subsp. quintayensis]|uniref:TetR/AcrR family transcriptional regulator n=1 Tax=Vibrio tapetis TaxID=52443 RepID=UPI0025B39DBC|nr:TetR/AcrR family transcriptional regulator [Vibrio tapetis]MDN3683073.1 TetR/AcrR family transcriptional regulator [Vibrio tapetis subsp. quintayensis]
MNVPKQTRSEIKREAIIKAAMISFKENGVKATSMDKLAELAQVSKRTVYNHFETKEALVMFILSDLWNKVLVQPNIVYQADVALDEQLHAILAAEVSLMSSEDYLDLSRVAFGHLFYHPEALLKEVEKIARQETTLHRWITAAAGDGKLKDVEPAFANSQLHSLIKGQCFWPQLMRLQPELSENDKDYLVQQTVAMFLSHYAS